MTSLEQILRSKDTGIVFLAYLNKIHAQEELEFWLEVEVFKRLEESMECMLSTKRIYTKFLSCASKSEINIEGTLRQKVIDVMEGGVWDQHLFDNAQLSVYETLNFNCVRSFRTEITPVKSKKERKIHKAQAGESLLQLYYKYREFIKADLKADKATLKVDKADKGTPKEQTTKSKSKLSLSGLTWRRPSIFKKREKENTGTILDTGDNSIYRRHSDAGEVTLRPRSATRTYASASIGLREELFVYGHCNLKKSASAPFWMETTH